VDNIDEKVVNASFIPVSFKIHYNSTSYSEEKIETLLKECRSKKIVHPQFFYKMIDKMTEEISS